MSRFLLLNIEEFGFNQDINKTIQPYNPFCICCLDRDGPMISLENCDHSDYLDSLGKNELKHFNQLACLQCHNFMKKMKSFQHQVIESFQILLSGTYTNSTMNSKRINNLTKQEQMEILHLPPEETETVNLSNIVEPNSNLDSFMDEQIQLNTNLDENINESSRLSLELNKNIKSALDILERNSQSFVSLGSQLQFLNGEHLSFLESSLLSKEILTDIPLVSTKADLDNVLIDSSKLEIEIDGPGKIFYDSLDLSPELMGSHVNTSQMIETDIEPVIHNRTPEPKITVKPKMKRTVLKNKVPQQIKAVRLSQDELNNERVKTAQSEAYLKFKFRCETCLLGFNYKENLEDHNQRKHGPKQEANVICSICSQVVATIGAMTEHNYRHYTRYECLQCGLRYHTHDEAARHVFKTHSKMNQGHNRSKLKRAQKIRKMKLNPQPLRNSEV